MPYQTDIATLYTQNAVSAFAKQYVLSFFNGKYLLPAAKQPQARFDPNSGYLKFDNGFTAQAQHIGTFSPNGTWQWAWADNTLPQSARQAALRLKTYGEQQHIEWLTQPDFAVTWQHQQYIAAIAAVLCGADGYHIRQGKLPATENEIFILSQTELAAFGQNDSQNFHSHILAEFAYYHEYSDKRLPYREAVAAYLAQHGYQIRQQNAELSARRGDDALHYVFNQNGRARDLNAFDNQQAGSPLCANLTQALPQMRLYPETEAVFSPKQTWLAKHLLPCFTLDLAALRPEWAGTKIHMLLPCEPEEGFIGETTTAAHTEFCTANWLAFRLDAQNRYEFLAAEDYFQVACEPDNAALREHIQTQQHSFAQYRTDNIHGQQHNETKWINRLGGKIQTGNWPFAESIPAAFACNNHADCYDAAANQGKKLLQQRINGADEVSITHQNKPFYFIASTSGWNWAEYGADDMLLFYEPESRIVLMTFEYS